MIDTCHELGIKKLAFISPYIDIVSAPMRNYLEDNAGIKITNFASFNEVSEAKVARIAPSSISKACIEIAEKSDCDAVFLSCTNLRTAKILQSASQAIGKPVLSSNSVLARHMGKLANLIEKYE